MIPIQFLKTKDPALAQKLREYGVTPITEHTNRQIWYCFPDDALEQFPDILSQFSAEAFLMDKTLSF